jgi:hypothetical protein
MAEAPTTCPTCGTAVPHGAAKCPGCGRVFGEANRCPHCHAVAAVRRKGSGYVCVACGKERQVEPGSTVLGAEGAARVDQLSIGGVDPASAAMARLLRFGGVLLVAAAVVAGAVGVVATSAPLVVMMVAAAALGAGGITAMSQAARVESGARERRAAQIQRRILALAEASGGELTATAAARALHLGLEEADAALTRLADGTRVTVEVDDEGVVRYVFRELMPRGPRVRVSAELGEARSGEALAADEQAEIEAEAAARVERELVRRGRV